MTALRQRDFISVEEYLEGEEISPIKHEYVDGVVYAMAGARNLHNAISGNVYAALHIRLRGRPCRPFNSDTKVRIRSSGHTRFYYPDVSVSCRPNPPRDSYLDEPNVVIEVLSHRTRRFDQGEKMTAYLAIPSLSVYVMLEQDCAAAIVYRRTPEGFVRELYEGMSSTLPLGEIGLDLPFAEIYEAVEFSDEPNDEDLE